MRERWEKDRGGGWWVGSGSRGKQPRGRDEKEFAGWMCTEEVERKTERAGEKGRSHVTHAAS